MRIPVVLAAAAEARSWVLSALMKITAQLGECPPLVTEVVRLAKKSKHVDTQQVRPPRPGAGRSPPGFVARPDVSTVDRTPSRGARDGSPARVRV